MTRWFLPGPTFGYRLVRIDDHPWDTLITMKEILRLQPGSLRFVGPDAKRHEEFWRKELPQLLESDARPVFELDTRPIHPHLVESAPRQPFRPYKDL